MSAYCWNLLPGGYGMSWSLGSQNPETSHERTAPFLGPRSFGPAFLWPRWRMWQHESNAVCQLPPAFLFFLEVNHHQFWFTEKGCPCVLIRAFCFGHSQSGKGDCIHKDYFRWALRCYCLVRLNCRWPKCKSKLWKLLTDPRIGRDWCCFTAYTFTFHARIANSGMNKIMLFLLRKESRQVAKKVNLFSNPAV